MHGVYKARNSVFVMHEMYTGQNEVRKLSCSECTKDKIVYNGDFCGVHRTKQSVTVVYGVYMRQNTQFFFHPHKTFADNRSVKYSSSNSTVYVLYRQKCP